MKKVMLIGLGAIGLGYDINSPSVRDVTTHAKAVSLHPKFTLVCGVDVDSDNRKLFTELYGAPSYETIGYAIQEVGDVDLVIVASPTKCHYENIMEVLYSVKPKAILCEKPISYSIDEAEKIVSECNRSKVDLYVNYIRRTDPGSLVIRELIKSGEFKFPIKGTAWYSKGFAHNGSHLFNILEVWLGGYQDSLMISPGRRLSLEDSEPDLMVSFKYGDIIFLSAWEESYSHYSIELLSPSGRIRYDNGGERITIEIVVENNNISGYSRLQEIPEIIHSEMGIYQSNVLNHLYLALQRVDNELCTGEEGLRTLCNMKNIIKVDV